jgi:protein SHQ1
VLTTFKPQASDVEIRVDGTLLIVHVNPYYLRLSFSHAVVEDDNASVQYDASSGDLTLTLTKQYKGQEFKDLDLLAKLLAPPKTPVRPTIEVLSSHTSSVSSDTNDVSPERREILDGESREYRF